MTNRKLFHISIWILCLIIITVQIVMMVWIHRQDCYTERVTVEITLPDSVAGSDEGKILSYLIDERNITPIDRVCLNGEWCFIWSDSY
jgi:hypothetical protein